MATTCEGNMSSNTLSLFGQHKKLILKLKLSKNMAFKCIIETAKKVCMLNIEEPEWLWHIRYGHLNFKILCKLRSNSLVYGLPKLNTNTMTCETYLRIKWSTLAFASDMPEKSKYTKEVEHSSICGPFEISSLSWSNYFINFDDEHARMLWLYTIKFKSDALEMFKKFKTLIGNEGGKEIKVLRIDDDREYTLKDFE